jgi:hypothetical protein
LVEAAFNPDIEVALGNFDICRVRRGRVSTCGLDVLLSSSAQIPRKKDLWLLKVYWFLLFGLKECLIPLGPVHVAGFKKLAMHRKGVGQRF